MADSTLVHNIMAALHAKFAAVPTTDVNGGISSIADTIDTYEATVRAPLPQSAAGVGQFVSLNSGVGNASVLPSGGTWIYAVAQEYNVNGTWNGQFLAGVAAGGTTLAAGAANMQWFGWCWRIA